MSYTLIIHPHIITYDKYICYTWEQLWKKIRHNKSVDRIRKYLKDSWCEIIWDNYMPIDFMWYNIKVLDDND